MGGISLVLERKLNESEFREVEILIEKEFTEYEIFAFGRGKSKENVKFMKISNDSERVHRNVELCKYDTICIIKDTNILFSKIPPILGLLDTNEVVIGEIEGVVKSQGFVMFHKIINKHVVRYYPKLDESRLKIGYALIPARKEVKPSLVSKVFSNIKDSIGKIKVPSVRKPSFPKGLKLPSIKKPKIKFPSIKKPAVLDKVYSVKSPKIKLPSLKKPSFGKSVQNRKPTAKKSFGQKKKEMFSFLNYPHPSEKEKIDISVSKDDYLYIPEIHSAKKTLTVENTGFLSVIGLISFALLSSLWVVFGINPILIFLFCCSIFYISNWTFKLYLAYNTLTKLPKLSYNLKSIKDSELPVYSILVPLYKEASVLKQIVSVINNLDYPKKKLDVKLLLESDDLETINAVKGMKLPKYFETIILPHSLPKGKPKALNVGLAKVRGKYLTIYDAEDIVDSDQLKKVYLTFKDAPENVGCVHSRLNFYNKNQNWLTKIFTTEYTYWYELCMPWLIKAGYTVPFGGNSVYFKTEVIKKIGGWDPYNVTEDCEIGMRLYRKGYVTEYVDSVTTEEAVLTMKTWIKQRSRWMKGYIVTSLVNLRHPTRLYSELGLKKFLSFFLIIPGTPLIHLLNLIFGTLTMLWFLTNSPIIKSFFPWYILYPSLISFIFGNFMMVYLGMIGSINNKYYSLVKWNLLSPFYWLMMAVATVESVVQVIRVPHFWEKTTHGVVVVKKENRIIKKVKESKVGLIVKNFVMKIIEGYVWLDKYLERKIKEVKRKLKLIYKRLTTIKLMKRWRK